MSHLDEHAGYKIRVEGSVDVSLVDWFGPIQIGRTESDERITTLLTLDIDQAALVGLIRHLHGLGIVLLSVERTITNGQGDIS
ncbi:MAG: hypothetical protein KF893_14490 [Caldilineaceae bacterium]|nr:hypothetical protein [Caldilineaceae bacterium]